MKNKRQGFSAGASAMLIVFVVIALLEAHGDKSTGTISWGDIGFFFVFLAVFASCVIDIYKYVKDI